MRIDPRPAFPVLVLLLACSRAPAEPASTSTPSSGSASSSSAMDGSAGAEGGTASSTPAVPNPDLALKWEDPSRWQRRKPSTPSRAAEYVVPRAGHDTEDGECIVITFGKGQGGSIEDNIDRWTSQFEPKTEPAKQRSHEVNHINVTRVDVAGTYLPMQMPGVPALPAKHPGWRLTGGIVQAPSGTWFFKITGPDATVKAASPEFDIMMDSVKQR
jgi:hypothetical protein